MLLGLCPCSYSSSIVLFSSSLNHVRFDSRNQEMLPSNFLVSGYDPEIGCYPEARGEHWLQTVATLRPWMPLLLGIAERLSLRSASGRYVELYIATHCRHSGGVDISSTLAGREPSSVPQSMNFEMCFTVRKLLVCLAADRQIATTPLFVYSSFHANVPSKTSSSC